MKGKIRDCIILIRPYWIVFFGLIPVIGALCNGQFNFFSLIVLFIIGLFSYIFGFVQNDYFDKGIDKKSQYVSERPLAVGTVTEKEAIFIFLFSFFMSLILAYIFLFTVLSFSALLLSLFLITVYNKYSKRTPGMEYVLGLGGYTSGLFGALTYSNSLTPLVLLVLPLALMQFVFDVGVFANLKDVKYDAKLGVRTTPIAFGVKVINNEFKIPTSFVVYAFFIKGIQIVAAMLIFLTGYSSFFLYTFPIPGTLFFILSITLIYTLWKVISTPLSNRDKMLLYVGLNELLTYLLIPVALMAYLVENTNIITPFLLTVAPTLWLVVSLRAIFGKKMMPLE